MFLTLGLFLFPSELLDYIGLGFLLSAVLMFIARPISVMITLIPFKFQIREKIFASWVGLRGAVPIILATFPLIMGIDNSHLIFNLVFFIVLTSALFQGWTIKLAAPLPKKRNLPIEFTSSAKDDTELIEIVVPYNSKVIGKQIVDLNFPEDSRIVLVTRDEKNIVPSGQTTLEEGDILSMLINIKNVDSIRKIFS
jgi:cell volume regulation protein A